MNTAEILAAIDEQIAHLQQARELIASAAAAETSAPRRGRPKGSTNKVAVAPAPAKASKRVMSAEGKARIVAAQKARWAAQKKAAAPAKAATKKSSPASAKSPSEVKG